MGIKVAKFGGSSLCDAEHFRKVKRIIESDPDYHYVVPSAPGKRFDGDEKITDLLYACQAAAAAGRNFGHLFDRVAERYREIAHSLVLPPPDGDLRAVYAGLKDGREAAWRPAGANGCAAGCWRGIWIGPLWTRRR